MTIDRTALFDGWAANYDESLAILATFPFDGYDIVLSTVVERAAVAPQMTILDIGIGTGNLAQRFVEARCRVWGTDFSPKMIAQAQAKLPSVTLVVADLLQGWPDELPDQFDRIVSTYVFHEFTLAERTRQIHTLVTEHLTPNGKLIIGDIMFPTADIREAMHQKLAARWDEEEFYWAADESQLALEAVGLQAEYEQISSCAGLFEIQGAL